MGSRGTLERVGGRIVAFAWSALFVACVPAQSARGLEHELQAARTQAALEQRRVYELEARLARLEARAAQPLAASPSPPAASDPTVQRQLDVLIAMNQELLLQTRANRHEPAPAPANVAVEPVKTQIALRPECNAGLTTEQKILALVLELKGERSPWRADGLSYEESQALRVLLRPERPLDRDNPWQ